MRKKTDHVIRVLVQLIPRDGVEVLRIIVRHRQHVNPDADDNGKYDTVTWKFGDTELTNAKLRITPKVRFPFQTVRPKTYAREVTAENFKPNPRDGAYALHIKGRLRGKDFKATIDPDIVIDRAIRFQNVDFRNVLADLAEIRAQLPSSGSGAPASPKKTAKKKAPAKKVTRSRGKK